MSRSCPCTVKIKYIFLCQNSWEVRNFKDLTDEEQQIVEFISQCTLKVKDVTALGEIHMKDCNHLIYTWWPFIARVQVVKYL